MLALLGVAVLTTAVADGRATTKHATVARLSGRPPRRRCGGNVGELLWTQITGHTRRPAVAWQHYVQVADHGRQHGQEFSMSAVSATVAEVAAAAGASFRKNTKGLAGTVVPLAGVVMLSGDAVVTSVAAVLALVSALHESGESSSSSAHSAHANRCAGHAQRLYLCHCFNAPLTCTATISSSRSAASDPLHHFTKCGRWHVL